MSAEAVAFARSWRVGRYEVTLSAPAPRPSRMLAAVIEWSPSAPSNLGAADLRAYRAGRDAAVADLARELGITVAVVEFG